jgi:response regulator NasT
MDINELRHETLDLLQTIYVLGPRLQRLLPADALEARAVVEQLLERARKCRDRVHGVPERVVLAEPPRQRLRVVVVEDDPATRAALVEMVGQTCGHEVVSVAATGPEMVRETLAKLPDLVVFDIHLPGIDGLTALEEISKSRAVAAVAITGDRNRQLIDRAQEDMILAYLLKPVDAHQVAAAIQLAWARFQEFDALKSRNQTLEQNLQDRKVIDRAKGMLMKWNSWPEAQAFRTLQQEAMNRRVTMVQVAQEVLKGQNLVKS